MEYVTEIGQQLFSYKNLEDGQRLDYTYFWGGRSSCKRSLLTTYGSFDQDLSWNRGHGARLPPRQAGPDRHPHSRRQELHGAPGDLRSVRRAMPQARTSPVALHPTPSGSRRSSATAGWRRRSRSGRRWSRSWRRRPTGCASSSGATQRGASWSRTSWRSCGSCTAGPWRPSRRAASPKPPRRPPTRRPSTLHVVLARLVPRGGDLPGADLHHRLAEVGHEHPRLVARRAQRALDRGRVGHLLLPAQGRRLWSAPTRRRSPAPTAPGCATRASTSSSSSPISAWD